MDFSLQIKNTVVFTRLHLEDVRVCIDVNSDGNSFNFAKASQLNKIFYHRFRIKIGQRYKPRRDKL